MIKGGIYLSQDPDTLKDVRHLRLDISGESLNQFREILSRALNTAPPEKWAEWVKLSDKIDPFRTVEKL